MDFFNIFDDPEQLSVPNPLPRRLAVLVKVDIHVMTRVDLDYVCPSVTDLELNTTANSVNFPDIRCRTIRILRR